MITAANVLKSLLLEIILVLIFANSPLSKIGVKAEAGDVEFEYKTNLTGSERSYHSQFSAGSGETIRLLDYFRNKMKDPQCNPTTNIFPCGGLEFLGCSGNKKFYSQSIIRLNWFDAWEFCRSNEMHLASIESNYEQVFMELYLPKPEAGKLEPYWLSGTDFGRKGLFFWMTNGHSFTFTNWRPGEPNNVKGQEHCVQMTATAADHDTMRWSDTPCDVVAYTICQEEYVQPDWNKLPDRVVVP